MLVLELTIMLACSCIREYTDKHKFVSLHRLFLLCFRRLFQEDCFIVMACDGVWDVLDDQTVCNIAGEHFGRAKDAAASVVRTGQCAAVP